MKSINKTDYDDRMHSVFQTARELPEETTTLWMNVLKSYVGNRSDLTFLDIGSGTGRFSAPIASHFSCKVIGVEPSDKMREKAIQNIIDDRILFIKGEATEIPIKDNFFNYAWMSMVIHHVPNKIGCAKEIYRLLRNDGMVFIRNAFKENLSDIPMYRYFPKALEIDFQRLPSISKIKNIFENERFTLVEHKVVNQIIDSSFENHIKRLRQRGISTLELLSNDDFEQGLMNMEKASSFFNPTDSLTENIDLLIFRKQ